MAPLGEVIDKVFSKGLAVKIEQQGQNSARSETYVIPDVAATLGI